MVTRASGVAWIALVLPTILGCGAPPPDGPQGPLVHLADLRYQHRGDVSTAGVPAATIGGERRPVLASVPLTGLKLESLPAPPPSALTLRVPIPEPLRGGALRLVASSGRVHVLSQKPRMVPEAGAEQEVTFELAPGETGTGWLAVSARGRPPEEPYLTEPVAVPPDARLRFGIGVDDVDWPVELPAATFTVTLVRPPTWWWPVRSREVVFRGRLDPASDPKERRWFDHEIDLGPHAGRVVQLEFAATAETSAAGAPFVFPVWSDPTIVARAAPSRPNLILISLDTLRADHLGCYGYARPTSPTIDELAARSAVFERAYSSFPSTTGSHMTLFTGLYPCAHGLGSVTAELAPDIDTLAEVVRAAGYTTAAFTEDGGITAAGGFARGFGTYVENVSIKGKSPRSPSERTFADALAWIERRARVGPWFVFIHTYEVHEPLAPPEGYRERVVPDGDSSPLALYDAEIRYLDDLVAGLLAGLERAGVADDTILVLFSDHGEQFGEHGIYGHQNSLYDTLLHVPLILHAPGLAPAGTRVRTPVGLVDVRPTVLDLLGLPPRGQAHGRSLVPLLQGRPLPDVPIFAELPGFQVAVRKGRVKWIVGQRTGRVRAFTDDDPGEERSVAALAPEGTALMTQYRSFCREQTPRERMKPQEGFDPIAEKLKALGYVQ
jgi:arylsulfatase A-like enzyme